MSLFRRVTRYRVSSTQNPQENRLTEVTSAVLERVDGLAHYVMLEMVATAAAAAREKLLSAQGEKEAALWRDQEAHFRDVMMRLGALADPRVRVATQRTTASRKFVDLELRLAPQPFAPGHTFLFWIEV